nr:ankyrin repeat protein [Cedratvirus plubellavi]
MIPEVNPLAYLDALLGDGKQVKTYQPSRRMASKALKLGLLHLFQSNQFYFNGKVCRKAARYGQLEILQWLVSVGYPLTVGVCFAAAYKGHLEILKWVHQTKPKILRNEDVCACAAEVGNLEILKWLRANDYPWNNEVCSSAVVRREHAVFSSYC